MKLGKTCWHISGRDVFIQDYLTNEEMNVAEAENRLNGFAQLESALNLIGDIAYDRDGYRSAEKLGELIDEIYRYARNPEEATKALGGE